MADVFISYKRERRPAAHHLQKILQAHGFKAWYDHDLVPGEDFERRLMAELRSARCVLVLWCGHSVRSPWVIKEATAAQARGTLTPVAIERATPPAEFAALDTIDLMSWDGDPCSGSLSRLLRSVGNRVGRDPSRNFNQITSLHEDWVTYGRPSLSRFQTKPAPQFDPAVGALAQLAAQANSAGKAIDATVQAAVRLAAPAPVKPTPPMADSRRGQPVALPVAASLTTRAREERAEKAAERAKKFEAVREAAGLWVKFNPGAQAAKAKMTDEDKAELRKLDAIIKAKMNESARSDTKDAEATPAASVTRPRKPPR